MEMTTYQAVFAVLLIFFVGDLVGALTKAKISSMFVIMMGFLVLFLSGIYPANIMEISGFAGLDTDYMGKPFGPIPGLMAIAEDVQKVHAICVKCGNLANHSHRLTKSHKLVVLGEKDVYEPLCRQCFNEALAAEKAAENSAE